MGEADALTLGQCRSGVLHRRTKSIGRTREAQQALGELEDAVQSPLTLVDRRTIRAAQNHLARTSK